MKFTRPLALVLLAAFSGQAEIPIDVSQSRNSFLVVGKEGNSEFLRGSAASPVALLKYLKPGDKLQFQDKTSSVTVTSLATGQRYQIKGNYTLPQTLTTDKNQVWEVGPRTSRQGIVVSHAVDMSKYGGYSSREVQTLDVPHTVRVNFARTPVVVDLNLSQFSLDPAAPKVSYRKINSTPFASTRAVVSPDRRLTLPDLTLEPGQTYLIYFGDEIARDDARPAFAATLLEPKLIAKPKELESDHDMLSQLESFENYYNLGLYWQARSWKNKIEKKYPAARADLEKLWNEKWPDAKAND